MTAAWRRAWTVDVGADITCPPVVSGNSAFARAGKRIVAIADGTRDWSRSVGLGLGRGERLVAITGGVATDDVAEGHTTVVAFDLDGQARWRVELDGVTTDAGCTPDGERAWWLVVDAGRPHLHVIDATTGDAWSTAVPLGSTFAAASRQAVFVAAPPMASAEPGLVRIDLEQRTQRRLGTEGVDAIVASDDRVFAVDGDLRVTCHDAATGIALWQRGGFGLYLASAESGLLSFSEDDGSWFVVNGDSGERAWSQSVEPLQVYGVVLGRVALLVDLLEVFVADPAQGQPICVLSADDKMITQAGQAGLGAGIFVAATGSSVVAWSAP